MRGLRASRVSLRSRLVTIIVVTATLAVTVLVIFVQVLLGRAATSDSVHVLRARADAAASTVAVVDGQTSVREIRSPVLDQNVWIFDAQGRRIDGAPPPAVIRPAVLGLRSTDRVETVVAADMRLFARPVVNRRSGARIGVVVAGLDLAPYESSERRDLVLSTCLGALIVLAAGAAGWASIHVSLGQVRRMVRSADEWREHDLSGRFDLGEPVDELSELGRTLDLMLDRIAAALHSERRLTDEVAHELRTPITVIRSEAQLALQEPPVGAETTSASAPDAGKDQALRAIVAATERMDEAITTMLRAARSTARDDSERCRVAETLEAVARHTAAGPGVSVSVDEIDMELQAAAPQAVVVAALAPLLDNAIRHAASGVWLNAETHGRRVLIGVRDDGPGVDEDGRDRIFQPGQSSRPDGAGLGLALARRLAHSMDGEVHDRGRSSGLFVLDLPIG